jgi:gamma-butyrobetaine dioxygenase
VQEARFLFSVKLRPGDLVAFDNTRLLHGRTAFTLPNTAGLARHLQGCYVDRDGLYSRLAVLR